MTINNATICSFNFPSTFKFGELTSILIIAFGILASYIYLFSYLINKSSFFYLDLNEKIVSIFFCISMLIFVFIIAFVGFHYHSFSGINSIISGGNPLELFIDLCLLIIWFILAVLVIMFRSFIFTNHQELVNLNLRRSNEGATEVVLTILPITFFLFAFLVVILFFNFHFNVFSLIFAEIIILQFSWILSGIANLPRHQHNIRLANQNYYSAPAFTNVFILDRLSNGNLRVLTEDNQIVIIREDAIMTIE